MAYEWINMCWVRAEPLNATALHLCQRTGVANTQAAAWPEGTHATEPHLGAELWRTRGTHAAPHALASEQEINCYVVSI